MAGGRAGARNKPQEQIGKNAPCYFRHGTMLNGRIRILKMFAGGGFGQVYYALDEVSNVPLAVKAVDYFGEGKRIYKELLVMDALHGADNLPLVACSGSFRNYAFIAMELLGANLSELRTQQPRRRFTDSTVLRVTRHVLNALRQIHAVGYLHRDIKPSNMCVGLGQNGCRNVYLVDFGMARRYLELDGAPTKRRFYVPFRGTMRYVSLTVHKRRDQGPGDDLWGLFYSLVELSEGALPWRALAAEEDVASMKAIITFEELCGLAELKGLHEYMLDHLRHEKVDFGVLDRHVQMCLKARNVGPCTRLDWETAPNAHSKPPFFHRPVGTAV